MEKGGSLQTTNIKSQSDDSDVFEHLSQTQKKRASGRLSPNSWTQAFMCWVSELRYMHALRVVFGKVTF
jgi:hypothetical protein